MKKYDKLVLSFLMGIMLCTVNASAICDPPACGPDCVEPFIGGQYSAWSYATDNLTYGDCGGQLNNTHSNYNYAIVTAVDYNCDGLYNNASIAPNETLAANPSLCTYLYPDPENTVAVMCPSYDRHNRPIVEADCVCMDSSTYIQVDCALAPVAFPMFNFTDPFFSEPGGFATTTTTTTTITTTTTTLVQSSGSGYSGFFPTAVVSAPTTVTIASVNQITGSTVDSEQNSGKIVTIIAVLLLSFAVLKNMK
jgi:hypothetical protein